MVNWMLYLARKGPLALIGITSRKLKEKGSDVTVDLLLGK